MRAIFGAFGAMIAVAIISSLGVRSSAFTAIGVAVGMGGGWLLYGMLQEKQERLRIERELEQDRIRYEQEGKK